MVGSRGVSRANIVLAIRAETREDATKTIGMGSLGNPRHVYLSGLETLASGHSLEDSRHVLRFRRADGETAGVVEDRDMKISQRRLQDDRESIG